MPQVAEVAVVQCSPRQALALALSPSFLFFFPSLSLSPSLGVFQRQKQSEAVPAAFGISPAPPAPPKPSCGQLQGLAGVGEVAPSPPIPFLLLFLLLSLLPGKVRKKAVATLQLLPHLFRRLGCVCSAGVCVCVSVCACACVCAGCYFPRLCTISAQSCSVKKILVIIFLQAQAHTLQAAASLPCLFFFFQLDDEPLSIPLLPKILQTFIATVFISLQARDRESRGWRGQSWG